MLVYVWCGACVRVCCVCCVLTMSFPCGGRGARNPGTIMLAEKCADMLLGREALAPEAAPVWVAKDWRTEQRSVAGE